MTLIEVLVALAIVAITLTAGIKAGGNLTNNAQRVSDLTAAQWCAENQLTLYKLSGQFPGIGDGEFRCEQLGRQLLGRQKVRATPNRNFRRVETQVLDESGYPIVTLTTVLPRF